MKPDEKLVYMGNQIAKFFATQGSERAADGVADHLQKFWDPDMRKEFLAIAAKDSSGFHPALKAAVPLIRV
ncbi:MAG TPA: formate dehydrogenase subunit delta [Rhizomicrobium sp.]|jgi:formate dehydrogenase subunit delta